MEVLVLMLIIVRRTAPDAMQHRRHQGASKISRRGHGAEGIQYDAMIESASMTLMAPKNGPLLRNMLILCLLTPLDRIGPRSCRGTRSGRTSLNHFSGFVYYRVSCC